MDHVMRRRCKSLVLAVSMLFSATAGFVMVNERVMAESGQCGSGSTYTLDDEGVLTITGTGEITESFFLNRNDIRKVIIQEGINTIEESCFENIDSLEEVEIPSTCNDIYVQAFYDCNNLKSLSLAEGVTFIDAKAFYGCTSLEELVIPKSVRELYGDQFGNCNGLKSVTLSSETYIDFSTFSGREANIENLYYDGTKSQLSMTGCEYLFENIEYGKFEVTYRYMDNHYNYDELVVDKNGCAPAITSPKEAWIDHIFTGEWYTDPDCAPEHLYDFTTPVTADLELYAKWTEEELAVVEGYRLLLTGEVGVEFFISIPESYLADENAKIVISNTVPGGKASTVQEYLVADADTEPVGGTNCFKFVYKVPAATMTCPISVTLKSGDKETVLGTDFTVKAYAEYIHAHPELPGYEAADPLVTALLNYGAYSQIYFGIDTENLANVNVTDNVADADPGEYKGVPVAYLPDDPPITYYGSSLNLQSKVSALVYFKVNKGVDYKDYMFQIQGGEPITPAENATPGFVSIGIEDINPADLTAITNRFVIRISGGEGIGYNYDYSPLYFMQAACASTSVGDDMKNLAKALYLYGEAAKAYLN